MNTDVAEAEAPEQVCSRFLCGYHKIWQNYFPGLNKRAHWHVMFSARCNPEQGVSCRSIHRTLYGFSGPDTRTCSGRVKDCERDGFIRVVDASNNPCAASPGCLIVETEQLRDNFDRHCRDTIAEVRAVFADHEGS